jgi:hypothetical protein
MTPVGIRLPFVLILALSAGSSVAGPEAVVPRYRFQEGEKLAYVVDVSTHITTSAFGQTNTADMTQRIDLSWEVGLVDADGNARITQTVERIRFKAVTPKETAEYDTGNETATRDPRVKGIAARLDAVVGARISARIDPRGHLSDVRLVEKAGTSRPVAPGEWDGLGNPSSETGFRRLIGQLIPVLAETVPAAGDTWSARSEETVPEGKATTEIRYTCTEPPRCCGRPMHKLSLAVSRRTENGSGETGSVTNGNGAASFDASAGRLVESSLTHSRETAIPSEETKLTRKVTETITLRLAESSK